MADFPVPREGIKVIYADDMTIYTSSGPNPDDLVDNLISYIETVRSFFQSLNVSHFEVGSHLFTLQCAQANKNRQVLVQGSMLKLAKTPT